MGTMTMTLPSGENLSGDPHHHDPVLLDQVIELLGPAMSGTLVDATLGLGGHTEALLERLGPEGRVLGIDRDRAALERAAARLARFGDAFLPLHGDHGEIGQLLASHGVYAVDGILFDLGVSSMQLDDPQRGFSFRSSGPLDMRMDPSTGRSAAQLLAETSAEELKRILWRFGEERRAGAIANEIVRRREVEAIETTAQLAQLVEEVQGPAARRFRIHPATRTFQALRIAVNGEIVALESTLTAAVALLRRGGRIAVLAYHSLEDRISKRTFKGLAHRCTCPPRLPTCGCGRENIVRVVTSRAIRPDEEETRSNPRSRSARLRVAERL